MPFPAHELYSEYEPDKYKTSTQQKVERVLGEAKKDGLVPSQEILELQEIRDLFEKDFLGTEEIETFLGRQLTQEEHALAATKWETKVKEAGLTRELLEQLHNEGFMVVLRTAILGKERNNAIPATVLALRKKFKRLFYNQDWYDDESFAKNDQIALDWSIVKKELLDETRSKNWDEQEEILKTWAEAHNLDPEKVKRRTPPQAAYDILAYYKARNERILEKDWDWSGVQSSGGKFVRVGFFDSGGLGVSNDTRGHRLSALGVCPAL